MSYRVLVDPDTGETVEVAPADVVGVEPYDYAQAARVGLALTREKRATLRELDEAQKKKARAEANYRRELAKAVMSAKAEHGATVAEVVAKGEKAVADAREAMIAAEGRERMLLERVRLHSEDRATFHRRVEWSMKAPGGEPE